MCSVFDNLAGITEMNTVNILISQYSITWSSFFKECSLGQTDFSSAFLAWVEYKLVLDNCKKNWSMNVWQNESVSDAELSETMCV